METSRRLASTNVFGSLGTIEDMEGSISFLLIVLAVATLELISTKVTEKFEFTRWETAITNIKSELMVVGTIAFILKCIIFSYKHLDPIWLHAIEFADLVIPITAFFFVMQGIIFIAHNTWGEKTNRRAFLKTRPENSKIKSMYDSRKELELLYSNIIFCDQFGFGAFSFDFNDYFNRVWRKHIIRVVSIEPADWALLLLAVFLNWARNAMSILNTDNCKGSERCTNMLELKLFTGCGFIVLAVVLSLAAVSHIYYRKCLHAHTDFINELCDCTHNVKTTLDRLVDHRIEHHRRKHIESQCPTAFSELIKHRRHTVLIGRMTKVADTVNSSPLPSHRSLRRVRSKTLKQQANLVVDEWILPKRLVKKGRYAPIMENLFFLKSPEFYFRAVEHVVVFISFYCSLWVVNFSYSPDVLSEPDRSFWKFISILPAILSIIIFTYVVRSSCLLKAIIYLDENILVEMLHEKKELLAYRDYIKDAIFSNLHNTDEESVVESFSSFGRQIIVQHCGVTRAEGEPTLRKLFDLIDIDHSNNLEKHELRQCLEDMDIFFAKKVWSVFLHCIDRDRNGTVEFTELCDFLFSDDI